MEEVKEEEVKTVLEESKENKKDKSIKRIIFLIIGVIGIIGTIILFYLFNCTITPDKLLNEMRQSPLIEKGIVTYETKTESAEIEIFENGGVNSKEKEFYDSRIEEYKKHPCYICILENNNYAKLGKYYFEELLEMKKEILKENYIELNEKDGYSIFVNKNVLLYLSNACEEDVKKEYINQFNIIVDKYKFKETNNFDNVQYESLKKSCDAKIQKEKKAFLTQLDKAFEEDMKSIDEYINNIEETQDEENIEEIKKVIKDRNYENIAKFDEKIIEWNNRIAEIENQIKQKKEAVVNEINEKLNNIYNTLNKEELEIVKKEIESITDSYYDGYKTEWNVKITDIEKKIEEKSAEVYKNACKTYSYKEVARNPENYKGKFAYFKGKVVQVMESNYMTTLRVNVTAGKYGYYEDTIYVTYYNINNSRILENDIVNIYGMLDGLETYTTIMGGSVTIPKISAMYIEIE